MPSIQELLILLIAIFVLWFVLKLVRLAFRVILFIITLAIVGGALWLFLAR
ncbi:MAG: hypothetical protein ACLGH0_09320 [Thermoanaerobaculia bacterium]